MPLIYTRPDHTRPLAATGRYAPVRDMCSTKYTLAPTSMHERSAACQPILVPLQPRGSQLRTYTGDGPYVRYGNAYCGTACKYGFRSCY